MATAARRAAAVPPRAGVIAAVQRGDTELLAELLTRVGPDDEHDAEGRTALALAVLRADARMARLLLQRGANRHAADRRGQTPQGLAEAATDPALRLAFGLP